MAIERTINNLRRLEDTGEVKAAFVEYQDTVTIGGANYTVSISERYKLPPAEEESMIPFEDLTQSIVEGWIDAVEDLTRIASRLERQALHLHESANRPSFKRGLPWS